MRTIIIPMAGRGQRFKNAGYTMPKPFIDIAGVPMIERVLRNLPFHNTLIIIALEEHESYVQEWLKNIRFYFSPRKTHIIYLAEITQGTACTVLKAREYSPQESELIVANCDQWVDWFSEHFIDFAHRQQADGAIVTFTAYDNKWSYVSTRPDGTISWVAEKQPISNMATVGIYWWEYAHLCFDAIEKMINAGLQYNGEYYLAPSYNELISEGAKIVAYPVAKMVGMGTPEELQTALKSEVFTSAN